MFISTEYLPFAISTGQAFCLALSLIGVSFFAKKWTQFIIIVLSLLAATLVLAAVPVPKTIVYSEGLNPVRLMFSFGLPVQIIFLSFAFIFNKNSPTKAHHLAWAITLVLFIIFLPYEASGRTIAMMVVPYTWLSIACYGFGQCI